MAVTHNAVWSLPRGLQSDREPRLAIVTVRLDGCASSLSCNFCMYLLVLASFEGFVPGVCYVRLYGQTAVFQDCTETSMSHFPVGTCFNIPNNFPS